MVDIEWESLFSSTGLLAQRWEGFKYRKGQEEMAQAILETFEEGGVAVIEAGTGTGKSLAYLAGAIKAAWDRDDPVIISTTTKNLQNQIMNHEVPLLQEVLPHPFKATLFKGRQNYLCLFKLHWAAGRGGADKETLAQVMEWARQTEDGDLERSPFFNLSYLVGSSGEYCLGNSCPYNRRCFYFKMVRQAVKSQVVVVNHHILLSHLAGENTSMPHPQVLVIDEAHKLERVAMEVLGCNVDLGRLSEVLEGITKKRSLLANMEEEVIQWLSPVRGQVLNLSRELLHLWEKKETNVEWERVVTPEIEMMLKEIVFHLDKAVLASEVLLREMEPEVAARISLELGVKDVVSFRDGLKGFVEAKREGDVRWVEPPEKDVHPVFRLIRVDVGDLLSELLFSSMEAVVLTSATLTVGGSFGYLRRSLGIPAYAKELVVESPFDWGRQMEVVLFSDAPDPRDRGYLDELYRLIESIVEREGGGTMCLFTAISTMRQLGERLKARFPHLSWYIQGDGPREALQRAFAEDPQGVLLGVASFWEGVDLPGDSLKSLVIVKLPFRSPDEPMVKAMSRFLHSRGMNPFFDFSLPDAVILFKQGIGRLIRTEEDRGRVYLLDPRIVKRTYGRLFLEALPKDSKVVYGEDLL